MLLGEEGNFAKTYHSGSIYPKGHMYFAKVAFNISSMEIICDDFTFGRKEYYRVGTVIHPRTTTYYGMWLKIIKVDHIFIPDQTTLLVP